MNVIPLTLVFSLGLTVLFIVLFSRELSRRRFTSAESDSLLPLASETPRSARSGPSAENPRNPDEQRAP